MYSCCLRRSTSSRRGTVTPLTVLNLALLVGVVALAVDGGTLMETRRHVQAAADAAALAAAADLYSNYTANQGIDLSGSAQASALATASANGFLNDGVQSTVAINTAAQTYVSGPNAGKTIPPGYVEVVIQYNADRLFSGIFGTGSLPVRARAVARGRCTAVSNNALLALNLNVSSALAVTGLGSLNISGDIQVNSSSSLAVQLSGLGGITATRFTLNPATGSLLSFILSLLSGPGGSSPSVGTSSPVPDPLRYLPPPDPVQLGLVNRTTGSPDLYPGIYPNGIQISSGETVTLHANSDGTPGIYYLQGTNGFQVSGSAKVTTAAGETAGIMIYNDWQNTNASISLKCSSSGKITITPPASGPYRGICLFQKRGTVSNPGPMMDIKGQANVNITGTIYAAYSSVSLSGQSSTCVLGGQIIADTVSVSGLAQVTIDPGTQPTANQRVLGLVE